MDTNVIALGFSGILGFLVCRILILWMQGRTLPLGGEGQPRSFHHTHKAPVSRLGGIGLAAAFIGTALVACVITDSSRLAVNLVMVVGCLAMFGLGLWDDFRSLGAKGKLAAQILIASGVYWGGIRIEILGNPFTEGAIVLGAWGWVATVIWLVALTNLINIIDGMDGLAGGIALLLMGLLAYVAFQNHPFVSLIAVGLAGALIAFLYFNFPPAKIYMGDGGAYLLGFLIGVMTISTSNKGTVAAALLAPLFALTLPIADVALAVLRRGMRGLPIFRPDRQHIHHRLLAAGLSRRRAVLVLYGVAALCALMACGVFWSQGRLVPILLGTIFLCAIFAVRFLGFVQDWWQVRAMLGSSLQLRKETRYALTMITWLELEADRSGNLQELWTSYLFIMRKLGFCQTRLVLDKGTDFFWKAETLARSHPVLQRRRVELRLCNIVAIEFASEKSTLPPHVFDQLAELAAEAWMKAVKRWQSAHDSEVCFEPAIPQMAPLVSPGRVLVANAL